MATTISSGTNPYKLGSPPDFGTLYSGRALEFDGVSDYVEIADSIEFDPATDGKLTISVWIKSDTIASGTDGIVGKRDPSEQAGAYSLSRVATELAFSIYISSGSAHTVTTSGANLVADRWHYVVVTMDDTVNTCKIYVDGELVISDTSTITNDFTNNTHPFYIGQIEADYFIGEITNVQLWSKIWSLSDVQYAYTHPEKLITHNSAVTSGFTTSDIIAWYPCTEGNPRSPQTTVYDGSPKGLSGELTTNGSFDADSDWTKGSGWTIAGGKAVKAAGAGTFLYQDNITTAGKLYRYTMIISGYVAGNVRFQTGAASTYYSANGTHTVDMVATNTDGKFQLYADASFDGDIDSVSVFEIQMGNHGTTTFYGDELITATQDQNFASVGVGNWVAKDSTGADVAIANVGSKLQVTTTTDNEVEGAYLPIASIDGAGGAYPIVAGRTYRISMDLDVDAGTPSMSMQLGGATSSNFSISTTETTETQDLTPTDATSALVIRNVSATALVFTVDNVSVKEIGVATGWTTADAEPLIPQTALMGMSKPMVFDGVDSEVIFGNIIQRTTNDWTASAWIVANSFVNYAGLIIFDGDGIVIQSSAACLLQDNTASKKSSTLSTNTLYHIVVTRTSTTYKVYVNGAEDTNAHSDAGWGTSNTHIGFGYAANVFDGVINEVSVWNDDFTLAQVQELFNAGVPLAATEHSVYTASGAALLGYWRNDGIVSWSDRSDNSNNSTSIAGSPETILLPEGTTSGKDILGFPLTHPNNGWLNLSGSEYVEIAENSVLSISTDITVEAWMYWTGTGELAIYHDGTGETTGTYFGTRSSTTLRAIHNTGTVYYHVDGGTIAVNAWYHVVMTYSSTGGLTIYTNTSAGGNDTSGTSVTANRSNHRIGQGNMTEREFIGSIDEVKIYNRALSVAEITKNYKHGLSKHS